MWAQQADDQAKTQTDKNKKTKILLVLHHQADITAAMHQTAMVHQTATVHQTAMMHQVATMHQLA